MNAPLSVGITLIVAFVSGLATWKQDPATPVTAGIARAARGFLDSLPPALRSSAQRALDDPELTRWNFVPGRYPGVEIGALDAPQRAKAHELLRAMLSVRGYEKTMAIVALENVLRDLATEQGQDGSHRDPDRYSLLVCGEPEALGTWCARFQGHHVSLRIAVQKGQITAHTPQFLGSHPHEQRSGPTAPRRILGAEEDLARAFLLLLDETQLARAVISKDAPADVLLGPGKDPQSLGERRGLPWSQLNETQRGVLWRLVEEYARVWRGELAEAELARIKGDQLDVLSFAWAGGFERGQGHYYRIHGVHFAIEYDNTQNNANHVHTLWRDFEHDFGGDALRTHLEQQHGRK
ncbi:MAG TPA: DUF3500 domain-containing protein [Planctomycetota bacterium]|nr:DUF3500 domain-containing protein [Planctomycetota bacterium]